MSKSLITNFSVSSLKAPLIHPFRTALGEHKSLENILFQIELANGTKGFGEAAIATHITGETINATLRNLKSAGQNLMGKDAADFEAISECLHADLPDNKAAVAAVEMAVLDALTRQRKIPLWKFFGERPQRFQTDITIVISDLAETKSSVKKFYQQGFRAFKVKIGRDFDLDIERVVAVKRLAPRSEIYLDANQGFDAKRSLQFLIALTRLDIRPDLMEQPVPKDDWDGLREVARLSDVPVCADESVSSLNDVKRAVKERAVPVINIKLMKSGLIQARQMAQMAKTHGIKLMIGGMMESSLAMTAAAHMAAGMGCFDFVDLDTPFFIKNGLKNNPYLDSRGMYRLRTVKAGIGIIP